MHLRPVVRIAILASGGGSNAQRLIEHFRGSAVAGVVLVAGDRPQAGVFARAWDLGVPAYRFTAVQLRDGTLLRELQAQKVDLVVLAGFLRLVPVELLRAFPDRVLNIHPALLPRHGGKGMWGHHVHAAVLAAGDNESGITIHRVNERYDEGEHLFQARCPVLPTDTPGTLAARVLALEHAHYPPVVERVALTLGR
ncbi:MAG: phosphoribosylglycinamide formyltransferase [Flavobacteriales bacterium]|nr:Phosphoribosylglycinamide formyltransferase [Flavobacteriales bacterium]MCC6576084.1 phosphoribosylglycinamide formyltransferase [Flavobacteriales bacterium]NUQ15721.1 phosphoribosylglycinamide formyltransferase [Flavobacteriales bacterium]